jgi:hypothetical protein
MILKPRLLGIKRYGASDTFDVMRIGGLPSSRGYSTI